MTRLRSAQTLLLVSFTAVISCGYASAQDTDKNPWMAEVAKAAAEGRCEEAKTIALRNGSLDVAERVLKLCTPSKTVPPAVQPVQAVAKPTPPAAQRPQAPVQTKTSEPVPMPAQVAEVPLPPPTLQTNITSAPAQCELHVWPAPEVKALTEGVIWNDVVNKAFDPSKGGIARPEALTDKGQVALLTGLPLPAMLGLSAVAVILHDAPLPRTAMSGKQRHASSTSTCYSELILSQMIYANSPLAGASLKTLLVIRRFGAAADVQASFSTWADRPLKMFPPKTPDAAQAANAELAQAYVDNIRRFGDYVLTPQGKKPPIRK